MRETVTILLGFGVLALGLPPTAAAQGNDGAHVRSVKRIVVDQERQRPRPRVVVNDRDGREEQTETFKRTVKLGTNGELDLTNITGNIEIKRGGGGDATIDVVKVARARTVEEAKELLPLVQVEINERPNRAEVRTIYPDHHATNNRRNVNVQVHYTVTAPAGTRVSARSISGNVRAAEITGELSLITISGDVGIIKGKRVTAAKTTSGTVSISDTESDARIEGASISGDVLVHRVKAARLELSTISGKVIMQDVGCDRIEAHSLSGEVEFTSPVIKGGRYEFNSHSGSVRLTVTGGGGYEVEANSWSGNVQSDVTLSGGGETAGRGPRRKSVRGVVGDGSAMVEITTFSGNVHIIKR